MYAVLLRRDRGEFKSPASFGELVILPGSQSPWQCGECGVLGVDAEAEGFVDGGWEVRIAELAQHREGFGIAWGAKQRFPESSRMRVLKSPGRRQFVK